MASSSEPRNPFYFLLLLASLLLTITALAYAVVPVLEQARVAGAEHPAHDGAAEVAELLEDLADPAPESLEQLDILAYRLFRFGHRRVTLPRQRRQPDALGARAPNEITDRMADVLTIVGLENDVYQFGLQSRLDPKANPTAANSIVEARH